MANVRTRNGAAEADGRAASREAAHGGDDS